MALQWQLRYKYFYTDAAKLVVFRLQEILVLSLGCILVNETFQQAALKSKLCVSLMQTNMHHVNR